MDDRRKKELVRWLSKQGIVIIHNFLEEVSGLLRYNPESSLTETFWKTLEKSEEIQARMKMKKLTTLEEAQELSEQRLARAKDTSNPKPSRKLRATKLKFGPLIKQLRVKGLSWRKIAVYLKSEYRYQISYVYLMRNFAEREEVT